MEEIEEINPFEQEQLEEKEYNKKKISVVENIVGKDIKVEYSKYSQHNLAQKTSKDYQIVLNGNIPIRTGIDHELSHIREGSLENTFWKPYNSIVKKFVQDNNLSANERFVKSVCHEAMNIMEDIRIESLDGYRFIGRKMGYEELCMDCGDKWKESGEEPNMIHGYLLAKRFFRDDLIPDEHIAEVEHLFDTCELNTVKGVLKLFKDWLFNGTLGKQILDECKELDKERDNLDSLRKELNELYEKRIDTNDKLDNDPMTNEEREELSNKREELSREVMQKRRDIDNKENEIYSREKEVSIDDKFTSMLKERDTNQQVYPKDNNEMEKQLTALDKIDSSKEQEKQIEVLAKEKRLSISMGGTEEAPPLHTMYDEYIPRPSGWTLDKCINQDILGSMRKLIATLKNKSKSTMRDEGEDIDIESMIECIKKGSNDFYIDNRPIYGTDILIAIDGSGSMDGDRLNICREMTTTMFKAVEPIPNITIKALVYGGSTTANGKPAVMVIDKTEDCVNINTSYSHPLTPTAEALIYSIEMIKKMKGKKKILLFLTDGLPQGAGHVPLEALLNRARDVYTKVKQTPHVVIKPIGIELAEHYHKYFKTIFGTDSLFIQDMEHLKRFISTEFRREIINALK